MRRAGLILMLLAAACAWGQDAPEPQDQPQPQMQRHGGFRRMGVAGTITAIDSGTITVKTMDGNTAQVKISDKTEFRKERQAAKLEDFKAGDQIFVRGQQGTDGAWQAEVVAERPAGGFDREAMRQQLGKRFIVGEIKSIDGTQLTIARPDGVNQTISVDENTSFRKDGQSVTLADLKPGDHVFGRGELKNNVFVPETLNVGDPRMMRRPGGGFGQNTGQTPDSH